jgi:hypothetical protein
MSVCSRHQVYDPDCRLCNTTPAELLGVSQEQWDAKLAEAEEAGEHECTACGMVFYLTVSSCPKCGVYIE